MDGGGFLVDADEVPGFLNEGLDGDGFEDIVTDAGEVDEAFGDFLDALGDAEHAVEPLPGGGVAGLFGHLFEGAEEDGEGRI